MRFSSTTLVFAAALLSVLVAQGWAEHEWMQVTMPEQRLTKEQADKLDFKLTRPSPSEFKGKTPQPPSSGKTGSKVHSQIVGGTVATRGQWPWQVVVHQDNSYLCGGSLISPEWVITAAHCAAGRTNFIITLGAQDRSTFEANRVAVHTTTKFVHEQYNSTGKIENDVAVIKLPIAVPVPTLPYWNTIRLPKQSESTVTYSGYAATASGWGRISDSSNAANQLSSIAVQVISNTECAQTFGSSIMSCSICIQTNYTGGAKSVCQGDSGGPLVVKEADGCYTLIGIASFVSSSGCSAGKPAVFARVSCYLSWINAKTGIAIRP